MGCRTPIHALRLRDTVAASRTVSDNVCSMHPAVGNSAGLRGSRPAACPAWQGRGVGTAQTPIPHLAMSHEPSLPSRPCPAVRAASQPATALCTRAWGARSADELLGGCGSPASCWCVGAALAHAHSLVPLPPSAAPRCRGSPNQQAGMGFLPPVPPAPAEPLPIPSGPTDPGHSSRCAWGFQPGQPLVRHAPPTWGTPRGLSCRKS